MPRHHLLALAFALLVGITGAAPVIRLPELNSPCGPDGCCCVSSSSEGSCGCGGKTDGPALLDAGCGCGGRHGPRTVCLTDGQPRLTSDEDPCLATPPFARNRPPRSDRANGSVRTPETPPPRPTRASFHS